MTSSATVPLGANGLVVLGDSVAKGWGDPHPAGGWIGWARRLADHLHLPADHVRNVASPGARVADVARDQLPLVGELRPDLVLLGCGMNDVLHGFEQAELAGHLATVFTWARQRGAWTIAAPVPAPPLMQRPMLSEFRRKRMGQRLGDFNAALHRSARAYDVTCVDRLGGLGDAALWSTDGIHLNPAGHAHVADVIAHLARTLTSGQPNTTQEPGVGE